MNAIERLDKYIRSDSNYTNIKDDTNGQSQFWLEKRCLDRDELANNVFGSSDSIEVFILKLEILNSYRKQQLRRFRDLNELEASDSMTYLPIENYLYFESHKDEGLSEIKSEQSEVNRSQDQSSSSSSKGSAVRNWEVFLKSYRRKHDMQNSRVK